MVLLGMRKLNSSTTYTALSLWILCLITMPAQAEEISAKQQPSSQVIEARYNWKLSTHQPVDTTAEDDFTLSKNGAPTPEALAAIEPAAKRAAPKEKKIEDRLLSMLPYKDTLKHTWNVIDGDVDLLTVEGLRFDRGNKGVAYTTSFIPFMGDVDGFEMEFCAGEDMEINFESDAIPFMNKVDGLSFKGSAGEEDNRISFRYTMQLP